MATQFHRILTVCGMTLLAALAVAATEEPAPAPAPISEGTAWVIPDLDIEMMPVAPGSFQMGSAEGKTDEMPVHEVTITQSFWLGKTEVTRKQWQTMMIRHPGRYEGKDTQPARQLSWHEAVSFCKKLTARERKAGRLPEGYVYRLPTEAEWEYAAQGGNQSQGFAFSGGNKLNDVGWFFGNSGDRRLHDSRWAVEELRIQNCRPHPVGEKNPNELGLHDMNGNVWEWCHDWYGEYPTESETDPVGPRYGEGRVSRGGGWYSDTVNCRLTIRNSCTPSSLDYGLGFRVALARPIPATLPPGLVPAAETKSP